MPAFNIKGVLLRELNTRNTQTLTVNDVGFGVPYAPSNGRVKSLAVALAAGTVPNAGQAVVSYNQLNLDTVFSVIGRQVTVQSGTSVYGILSSIRRYTGLDIQTADVVDASFTWANDNTAAVTLTASSTSRAWTGATRLALTLVPQNLNTLFTASTVDVSAVGVVTPAALLAAENKANNVYVPLSALTFGTPSAVNGSGYNTSVVATAVAGSGYSGTVTFRYTRRTVASVFGTTINVLEDVVNAQDLVKYFVALKGNVITASDLVNNPVTYTTPPSASTISADPSSWTYAGDSSITVLRRSDTAQKITINLVSDDLAYTQAKLQNAITAVDNGSPFADVTINIAKNVTIVAAASTVAALVLDNYGTIQQTNWYINNQGTILGRGGNGAGVNQASANPGQPGGDAINVLKNNLVVVIDNQGRIAGGGGGGGQGGSLGSGYSGRGGGGAPFGVSGDGATGTATLTTPTGGATGYSYPIQNDGGKGGTVATVGGDNIQTVVSNGATQVTGKGGAAGKALNGILTGVTWKNRGVALPTLADVVLPGTPVAGSTYTGAPFSVYLDPANSAMGVAYYGYIQPIEVTPNRLQNEVGLTAGTLPASNLTLVVAYIDGRFVLIPTNTKINGIAFSDLYNAGLVYGDGTVGATPPSTTGVTQFRLSRLASDVMSVRLFQGANVDPIPGGSNTVGVDMTTTVNSEWDRLMYLLVSGVTTPTQPFAKWTGWNEATWGLNATAAGSYTWTKETHNFDGTPRRAVRGGGTASNDPLGTGVRRLGALPVAQNDTTTGWRPVFEFLRKVDLTEYNRFVAWLGTNPSTLSAQLSTGSAMGASPNAANSAQMGAGNPSIWDKLIAVNMTPAQGTTYGSSYMALFSDTSSWGVLFDHALPNYNTWDWLRTNAPMGLVFLKSNAPSATTGLTRNLLVSSNGTVANNSAYSLAMTQFVYFDPYRGKMMQCNPYTGSVPTEFIFWAGAQTALTSLVTKTSMGKMPANTTDQTFISNVAAFNGVSLSARDVMFSQPVAYTGPEGNTKVTITAVTGGQYTGSVDVFFNRTAFASRNVPRQQILPDTVAFTGTVYQYLMKYAPSVLPTYFGDVPASNYLSRLVVMPGANPPSTLVLDGVSPYLYTNQPSIDIAQTAPAYNGVVNDLSSLVTTVMLGTLPGDTVDSNFVNRIPVNTNPVKLDPQWVTVSAISDSTDAKGNSQVTVTAKANGPYTGSIQLYFTRSPFATGTLPTKLYRFADDSAFTGTEFQYLSKYFPSVLSANFPNRSFAQFNQTVLTIAAGDLPATTITAAPLSRWVFTAPTPIAVNPADSNWVGTNGVVAWDSSIYVASGFKDKLGVNTQGFNNVAGTTGNSVPTQANKGFAYGGGLQLKGPSMVGTTDLLPSTAFTDAFTIDFWMYLDGGQPAVSSQSPWSMLYAAPSITAFNANARLQVGPHDATLTGMAVWNNQAGARLIPTSIAPYATTGWHHVAMTYDGSGNWKWYRDGVLIMSASGWSTQGGSWQIALYGNALGANNTFPVYERYRYRKGVKLVAGYKASDLYNGS
jgi:hypothetical protein